MVLKHTALKHKTDSSVAQWLNRTWNRRYHDTMKGTHWLCACTVLSFTSFTPQQPPPPPRWEPLFFPPPFPLGAEISILGDQAGRLNKRVRSCAADRGHKGTSVPNNRNGNQDAKGTHSQPKPSMGGFAAVACLLSCFLSRIREEREQRSVRPIKSKNMLFHAGLWGGSRAHASSENSIFKRSLFLVLSGFSHVRHSSLGSSFLEIPWCPPGPDRLLPSLCQN